MAWAWFFAPGLGRSGYCFGVYCRFWTHLSHDTSSLVEDQAVEIVGEIGQCQFGFGARQANGANEQSEPVFLMSEDMLDPSADG